MKFILAFVAVCLVTVNAASVPLPPVNYEGMVDSIVSEITTVALQTAETLEHQFEEIVLEPLQQVEAAVQSIEERRAEEADCVAQQDAVVETVVDAMHDEMSVCGVVAAKTSAQIMNDVNAATQQLVFDGYDVVKTYNKCRNYKNSILKNSCYARLTIKATLYMKNARKSIKTIRQSTSERVPAVFTDADVCTHVASDKAVAELDQVQAEIDACAVRKQ